MVVNLKRLKGAISIYLKFLDELDKFVANEMEGAAASQIRLRLDNLVSHHTQFLEFQTALELEDDTALEATTRTDVDRYYYKLRPLLEDRLEELKDKTKKTTLKPIEDLAFVPKLPELTFELFHGEPTKFRSFIESFDTHIHNNPRLNDFIKFQYLKSCCKGPGAKPFENLEFVAGNYQQARELLFERFNRTNRIVEEHVNSLFKIKPIERPTSQKLLELLDEVNSHLRSLKVLGRPTEYWDDLIIHLIGSKFDPETRSKWREESPVSACPTVDDISNFIKKRSYKLEGHKVNNSTSAYQPPISTRTATSSKQSFGYSRQSLHATNTYLCVHCNQTRHSIMRCYQFLGLSGDERRKRVEELRICSNCLRANHCIDNCPVEDRCRVCNDKHHTLLHITEVASTVQHSTLEDSSSTSLSVSLPMAEHNPDTSLHAAPSASKYIFLATALVAISDTSNRTIIARAMLDSGSMLNFITKSLASRLGLKTVRSPAQIKGIGGSSIRKCESAIVEFRSRVSSYSASMEVHILPKISEYQPTCQHDPSNWSIPSNIELADPRFSSPQKIDLLIGAELFFEIQSVGQINLGNELPILQNTRLGWVVSGRLGSSSADYQVCHMAEVNSPPTYLDTLMERFWTIEEGDDLVCDVMADNKCEEHFIQNYTRSIDGRFVVKLPFSRSADVLGISAVTARRRFLNLEAKLNRNVELRDSYHAFMREYISLDHMEPVASIETNHFYLPHHCVLKPDSTSTKVRVVFDGSAKTSCGISLNETLMSGPVIQNDLFTILLRFRSHAYAISADVTKMYRQIHVHPDDRRFQYIYWRFDSKDPLLTYQLKTVTYGTTPASFLSTRCLLQLSLDHESIFPTASCAIRNDMYVDDLLSGSNSKIEALSIRNNTSLILQSAGMSLRKWCSNDSSLLIGIPDDDREQCVQINDDEFIKTLGLFWQSNSDTFRINVNFDKSQRISKRTVISEVAKIFDPIGLISPVVVLGKMFMQRLWQLRLNWDESLPMNLHTYWTHYRENLQKLQALYIPRHIFNHCRNPTNIQIHGFADASQRGYGAAVYVRSHTSGGVVTRLLCSKSRVAPVKQITLPRLELLAAHLLSKLITKIKPNLNFVVHEYFFWTDSMTVLHWLNAPSARWKTFVANRVSSIQSLVEVGNWRHVQSRFNPADLISRGLPPDQLISSELWWYGPSFLQAPGNSWPQLVLPSADITELSEQRGSTQLLVAMSAVNSRQVEEAEGMLIRIHARNSFLTMQNAMSYIMRFIHNTRNPHSRRSGPISTSEAAHGLQAIIRIVQMTSYPTEYNGLQDPSFVVRNPKLKSLALFMSDDRILRVGGRLKFSSLSYTSKHPALLPPNHFFTETIFLFIHRTHFHVGPQGLLAAVRCNYWPINGRRIARKVFKQCVSCTRARPILLQQRMGDLPPERVNQAPPFCYVGVDYCGPFYVHFTVRGKVPTKAYLAVFVCFVTKAVHLELASSLTTASFMGTLKRFISTRGLPKKIVSDNGTNFVGANTELHELFRLLQGSELNDQIQVMCQRDKIDWSFAPPGAPHFGGLYEAAVKSAKYHLRRLTTNAKLTYEQLTTLIKQVESVLNSRPMIPITTDDVLEALTPGHFLIGRPLNALPELASSNLNLDLLTRWDLSKGIFQIFWSRWSKEYIQELQQRHLWTKASPNIKIGTIVVIKEDEIPPLKWKLGKIIDTHPGVDGLVRVVTIKTATGEMKRPVTKIAPLLIHSDPSNDQGGEDVNDQQSVQ